MLAPSRAVPVRALAESLVFVALVCFAEVAIAADIEALWEYGDPALSESRFQSALAGTSGDERLALLTQIARTFSLRKRFDDAHRLLDEVAAELKAVGPRPRVRYLLERGRTFNSAGAPERARPFFVEAWELARSSRADGLAVDAAHMVAITFGGTEAAIDWNQKGLTLARSSKDAKAQALIPAMLNNSAWDLHDMGRYAQALPLFQQALAEWTARARPTQVRFARWSVARCLRSLGRFQEALPMQLALEREDTAQNTVDGYVLEEIAELYEALGRQAEARPYFARAATALSADADFVRSYPDRFARLRTKGQ
ncbi:MAG TPA: tetratricopeptide repeat protein [Burkholderiaceae bacterium]|nr:tetratricopeptide repeat protein [Burkholderiaceae bacterium]